MGEMQSLESQLKSVSVGTKPSIEGAQIIVSPLEVWGAQRGKRLDVELMKSLFEERAGRDKAFARDVVEAGGGSRAQRRWYENVAQRIRGMEKCNTPAEVDGFLEAQGLNSDGRYGRLLKKYFAKIGESYPALEYRKALGIPLPEEIMGGKSAQKRGVGLKRETPDEFAEKVRPSSSKEAVAQVLSAEAVTQAREKHRRLTGTGEQETAKLAEFVSARVSEPVAQEPPFKAVTPTETAGKRLRRLTETEEQEKILSIWGSLKLQIIKLPKELGVVAARAREKLPKLSFDKATFALYKELKEIPKAISESLERVWTAGLGEKSEEERGEAIRRRQKTAAAVVACVGVGVTLTIAGIYLYSHPELGTLPHRTVSDLAERLGDIPRGVSGLVQHFHERIATGPTPTAVPPVSTHIPISTPGIEIPGGQSMVGTITQRMQEATANFHQQFEAALRAAREAAAAAPTPVETPHANILNLISRGIEIGRGQGPFQAAESLARTLCQSVGVNNPSSEVLLTIQDAVKDQIGGSGFKVGQHLAVNSGTLAHALDFTAQGARINIEAGRTMPVNLNPQDVEVLQSIARAISSS